MTPSELLTATKMQADAGELRFETGLSNLILNDVHQEPDTKESEDFLFSSASE